MCSLCLSDVYLERYQVARWQPPDAIERNRRALALVVVFQIDFDIPAVGLWMILERPGFPYLNVGDIMHRLLLCANARLPYLPSFCAEWLVLCHVSTPHFQVHLLYAAPMLLWRFLNHQARPG